MRIDSLTFVNYRNIRFAELNPSSGVNLIYGDNAQGKTNLVEGIWLLSGERPFRFGKDSDLIYLQMDRETERTLLHTELWSQQRQQQIEIRLYPKKQYLLNEIGLSSRMGLAGVLGCVVFSPVHLSLIQAGPAVRREFIDTAICQLKPQYAKVLADYQRVLTQRASLLREVSRHRYLLDTLDIWDSHLVRLGKLIITTRHTYLKRLERFAAVFHAGISGEKEQLQITYLCSGVHPEQEEQDIAAQLRCCLTEAREEDIRTASNTVGPHRDDINILLNGLSARSFGSQGQQRSAVLSLKLAECELMQELMQEPPVVLLDDVMSELDRGRREYLLQKMGQRQVFITACDDSLLQEAAGARLFYVKDGQIIQK